MALSVSRSTFLPRAVETSHVSCRHAEVRYKNGAVILYDLNSTHGTFVNGKRIAGPCSRHPGDVIGVGQMELVFR